MICPNCFAETSDGSKFCGTCGQPIGEAQEFSSGESHAPSGKSENQQNPEEDMWLGQDEVHELDPTIFPYSTKYATIGLFKLLKDRLFGDKSYGSIFDTAKRFGFDKAVIARGIGSVIAFVAFALTIVSQLPYITTRFQYMAKNFGNSLGQYHVYAGINENDKANLFNYLGGVDVSGMEAQYWGAQHAYIAFTVILLIVMSVLYYKWAKPFADHDGIVFKSVPRFIASRLFMWVIVPSLALYAIIRFDYIASNVVFAVLTIIVTIVMVATSYGMLTSFEENLRRRNSTDGKRAQLQKDLDKAKRAADYHSRVATTSIMHKYHGSVAKDYRKEQQRIQNKLDKL